ncbi:sulfite reductase (NADPH) flavoprotein alpha-component [Herbaspirillum sp. SJZ130]|nr:sulfite reductase (NADPH) flavoprotein alpha-component [Herbaspirillum sp. SJZ102]TQK13599.1 sulfite reductase (NADPH) flavoprotein alpha-component [Herbaspirillum sp. SJZ130]TQK15602.1 sulfite reductase (NADPH) flavoprotein alpha-component [Herbaspirillum sp. SJZ106]
MGKLTASTSTQLVATCAAAVLAGWGAWRTHMADSMQGRWLLAALIALAYLVFCTVTVLKYRRAQREQEKLWAADASHTDPCAADGTVLVVFASQTGFAEQLALQSAQSLRKGGMAVRVLPLGRLTEQDLQAARQALFIASTTGEGDAPDGAAGFARRMADAMGDASLAGLQFGVLALGDRSYARYCAFGHALAAWLRRRRAQPLFDTVEVDNGEEGALRHWQHQLGVLSGHTDDADWSAPSYGRWRLAQRRLLNPGSAGGPAFHLSLTPLDLPAPQWQAGDIAEIGPRNGDEEVHRFMQTLSLAGEPLARELASRMLPQEAAAIDALRGLAPAQMLAQLPPLPHREYSIASLPQDGTLDLLVRRMAQADGRPGIGSGWLTLNAREGQELALRVRSNSGFHAPPDASPLILVGNGTGLAGLRAHLRARAAAGHRRNWLVFGERSRATDFFHRDEIEAWQAQGMLERLDLAFSRDQAGRVYVQDRLRQSADALRQWVGQGAYIYVCGSLQGMAAGVAAALQDILGAEALIALAEQGRYRRDVY